MHKPKSSHLGGICLLILAAVIWGVSFVAQSAGIEKVQPFTFNGIRLLLGGIVLLPFALLRQKRFPGGKRLWLGGISCGVFLFTGTSLQTYGLLTTSAGKSGFITALYIILVPMFGLFLRRKVSLRVWIAAGIALTGMALLCLRMDFSIAAGDVLLLLGAVAFALHIWVIELFAAGLDGVALSCIQFFTAGILSVICMTIWDTPRLSDILSVWLPIAYAGILSCGVAHTFQILGQQRVDPALASLILSAEAVFASLAGWALLGEALTLRELVGCGLVFFAILIAQWPEKRLDNTFLR